MYARHACNKHFFHILLCLCWAVGATALAEDQTLIVKVTDISRRVDFRLMTRDEYKSLQRTIAEEKGLCRKAMELAERAWDADQFNGGKSFPASAISIRKASLVGRPYNSREEASDKIVYYENKKSGRRIAEKRRAERKYRKLRRARGLLKADRLEEEARDREEQALCDRARALYNKTFDQLMRDRKKPPSSEEPSAPAYIP